MGAKRTLRQRSALLIAPIAVIAFCATSAFAQGQSGNAVRANTASAAAPTLRVESLEMEIGEQRVIPSEGVQSYSEGSKGVIDIRLTKDASQFVVVALKEGQSTLLFLMTDGTERHYKVTVKDPQSADKHKSQVNNVQARDNIRLDFYFVQLSRSDSYQIGLGWPRQIAPTASATFDLTSGSLGSATAVISDQALPRLDMGQSSGWAKVMRQAAVVTANGEKASFAGGGEVNIAINSAMSTGIQKIPYGSQIDVEPVYDSKSGRVELRLHADVSELESDGGSGVPGRTTATLDTVVNLELGQSLILGGLTAKSERRGKSGLPVLSQIPILGALFGSHTYGGSETENVVIIVPSVVDAVSMQDRRRLENALERYEKYSGDTEEGPGFVPAAKVVGRLQSAPGVKQ